MNGRWIFSGWLMMSMVSVAAAGPYAPAAGQAGTTAIGINDPNYTFVAWASGWQDYQVGSNVDPNWDDPSYALGEAVGFLKDGQEGLRALLIEGRVVSLALPTTVDLVVTETDPAIKGATAQAQLKPATLETGHVVQVPLFIEPGERLKVDTRTGEFISRA